MLVRSALTSYGAEVTGESSSYRTRATAGGSASTPRSRGSTSTGRPLRGPPGTPCLTQGAPSNDKVLPPQGGQPSDHAIGRSRGDLTTKTHALVDGRGLPLVIALTPGQAGDSTALRALLGDRAYSARAHRARLRSRGITTVSSPNHRGRSATRAQPAGDWCLSTPTTTRTAASSSAPSTTSGTGAAWPLATTNTPSSTEAASSSHRSSSAVMTYETRP